MGVCFLFLLIMKNVITKESKNERFKIYIYINIYLKKKS